MNPNQDNKPPQTDQNLPNTTPAASEIEGVEFTETPVPSEQPTSPAPTPGNVRPMKPWEIEEAMKESGAEQAVPQQTMVIGLDEDEKEKQKKQEEQTLVTGVVPEEEAGPKIVYDSVSSSRLHKNKDKPLKLIIFVVIGVVLLIAGSAFAIYNL